MEDKIRQLIADIEALKKQVYNLDTDIPTKDDIYFDLEDGVYGLECFLKVIT